MTEFVRAQGNWERGFGPPPKGNGLNGWVNSLIKFQSKIVAGGNFTQAGSLRCGYIASYDGKKWSDLGQGLPCSVTCLKDWNSQIIACCWDGRLVDKRGKLESDNTAYVMIYKEGKWQEVAKAKGGCLRAMQLFQNKLFLGGDDLALSSETGTSSSLWYWDGTNRLEPVDKLTGRIEEISIWQERLVVIGKFKLPSQEEYSAVALLDGTDWQHIPWQYDSMPSAVTTHQDSLFIAGPSANSHNLGIGLTPVIAMWDGHNWKEIPFPLDSKSTYNPTVEVILSDKDTLILGGDIFLAEPMEVGSICQWNGEGWESYQNGLHTDWPAPCWVADILVSEEGMYAGGNFDLSSDGDRSQASSNIGFWSRR